MTKEEFEKDYIERSAIDKEYYHKHFVTLPCRCESEYCKGWACVSNHPDVVKRHKDLY